MGFKSVYKITNQPLIYTSLEGRKFNFKIRNNIIPEKIEKTDEFTEKIGNRNKSTTFKLKINQAIPSDFHQKCKQFIEENELSSKIPSRLRMDLYSLFNTKLKLSHVIDIDHFVPKSCGGPGNIIENLLPIGFSLNRYKSNSVPAGLFEVAKKYKKLKKYCRNNYSEKNKSGFIRNDTNAFENALKINQYIADLHISEAKLFYKSVMQKHYPEYVKIINKF